MLNHPRTSQAMETYDHIELTEQETNEALRLARRAKHFSIENEKYRQKISAPPVYPKLNENEVKNLVVKKLLQGNPDFKINDHNSNIIDLLSLYFSGDSRFEDEGYSLEKGIFLVGPLGCGKTSIMKAFTVNSFNSYLLTTTRKVSEDYTREGADTIDNYSELIPVYPQYYFGQNQIGVCFDDLGAETNKKHFGNESNVMTEIIQARYDKERFKGKTHFTGNMTGTQIEELYGSRVRSRLREMCNFIAFDPKAPDFRK